MHGQRYAHKDLKPQNILLAAHGSHSIKVIDFGTSHHYGD